jgi:toxin ParE1/3/4
MEKSYQTLWTPEAENDAAEILDYIDDSTIEVKVRALWEERAEALEKFPQQGRVVPELRKIGVFKYRELIRAPWRIVYTVENKTVWIMAVLDGRRYVQDLLFNRFTRK